MAYEMRISDWSSDVCSSDLSAHPQEVHREEQNVYADEEDPEMNLTQELVELPAADLREPVIEAGKKRKDRAKRQHIMEVGNHIIGVVQIVVDTTVGQYHAGNAADREEENETDRPDHRSLE